MTMNSERLAELDAVMAKATMSAHDMIFAVNLLPDLRAHIDAQAATIAGLLSDASVEAAALAILNKERGSTYNVLAHNEGRYRDMARAAISAALTGAAS